MGHPPNISDYMTVHAVDCRKISSSIFELRLQQPDKRFFTFKPGQYAFLQHGEHEARPYSIASSPDQDTICFHIKDTGHGLSHGLSKVKENEDVLINYPHGSAVYRETDRPILAIGGGLGLAPLVPIVRAALKDNPDHRIFLYHGTETEQDLYLHAELENLSAHFPNLVYRAVTETPNSKSETGLVGDIAAIHHDDLSGFDAYISGAPTMVIHTVEQLEKKGLKRRHIFTDAPL